MKRLLAILPVLICLQSLIASDWVLTKYYPWIYDPDNGWYFVTEMSDYVWSEGTGQWMRNPISNPGETLAYRIVDTNQALCFGSTSPIDSPESGQSYYGQDAQFPGNTPSYTNNGDGTVMDNVTGLMWQQSPDTNGDGIVGESDKLLHDELSAYAASVRTGGYTDWRVPTIKELYSLIQFNGIDPSGMQGNDASGLTPFIDDTVFDFSYGDTGAGVRLIDAQYWSSTDYVSTEVIPTTFGVNFADGRIKGYGLNGMQGNGKSMFLLLVRGNSGYGVNTFDENGDGTVVDRATGLMWSQDDSHISMDWEAALAWVAARNAESYLGYTDWRLPDIKELQSIVDYSRSPATTGTAAIDPVFDCTPILNELGDEDFGYYWSSTTHQNQTIGHSGETATYIAFGRSMGFMNGAWIDVHGAGSQRSDPKTGDPSAYPAGRGPQGDAIHIYNLVRLVRNNPL